MDLSTIKLESVGDILHNMAGRVKLRRLEWNLTQKDFARRAGIGYDAYRKFEHTGEITLRNLLLCAILLDEANAFNELFTQVKYQSIEEVLNEKKSAKRQRASKK